MLKRYLNKENLHHAYLLKNTGKGVLLELKEFLENELRFTTNGNPDFWCGEFDTFGINDGREITQLQSRTATEGSIKVFIIMANFFTIESQNSLLKMFEEPTPGTHFFIITQNTETLLPTLRSRLFIPETHTESANMNIQYSCGVSVDEFLNSSQAGRIELLKDVIEMKDKNTAISFLNELEITLYKKFQGSTLKKDYVFVFEEILKAKKFLNSSSPSIKMILEHIAVIVPVNMD